MALVNVIIVSTKHPVVKPRGFAAITILVGTPGPPRVRRASKVVVARVAAAEVAMEMVAVATIVLLCIVVVVVRPAAMVTQRSVAEYGSAIKMNGEFLREMFLITLLDVFQR